MHREQETLQPQPSGGRVTPLQPLWVSSTVVQHCAQQDTEKWIPNHTSHFYKVNVNHYLKDNSSTKCWSFATTMNSENIQGVREKKKGKKPLNYIQCCMTSQSKAFLQDLKTTHKHNTWPGTWREYLNRGLSIRMGGGQFCLGICKCLLLWDQIKINYLLCLVIICQSWELLGKMGRNKPLKPVTREDYLSVQGFSHGFWCFMYGCCAGTGQQGLCSTWSSHQTRLKE